ncbi:MAG: PD-(D/E)XK nuclease family protein [Candidatus Aenigmarchaeota archaeon]|nr:PD-(D/E)XK nuclease family protein [Candidatus Aenigmarchaeota archaeon]
MKLYSHSRIKTFETCPLMYKFEYVDKLQIEEFESIEAFLGSRVHEAMRKLYQDVKFAKIPILEEILNYYNIQWEKNWHDNI